MDPIVSRYKISLDEDELNLSAIDELADKYFEWLKLSKETTRQRKTRSANRRVDQLFEEILEIKHLPFIDVRQNYTTQQFATKPSPQNNISSSKSSIEDDSSGISSNCGRTLRPRSRTPSITREKPQTPSTPVQQSLRSHMKKNGGVLSSALTGQHQSVSLTKIRQLMRADSAQKKRDEEKERQEKMRLDRKAKEERAEQQKKQMLEERAITAKQKREQRLKHAAEVREARERARKEQKANEEQPKKATSKFNFPQNETQDVIPSAPVISAPIEEPPKTPPKPAIIKQQVQAKKMNETIQLQNDNIDISIPDETQEEEKAKSTQVASWAKAPHLREAIIQQFSKSEEELLQLALDIFLGVKLPVNIEKIFGSVHHRYLHRTSSAVWSPANGPLKRTSSMVMTPTNPKR